MNVFLRADASLAIGTGHLMRCLTLANGLLGHGAHTTFVCRHIPQNLQEALQALGHACIKLPAHADLPIGTSYELAHGAWLGVAQNVDAQDTLAAIGAQPCDWLIVDHYALDASWERTLRRCTSRILAIDDLADRQHDCDLLLDQNLYADARSRYLGKLPVHCHQLLGPRYALLRPEFARARSKLRPRDGVVRRILLFFGGMDAADMTSHAMSELVQLGCHDIEVDVVIGANHPSRDAIAEKCHFLGWACHVQTQDMAKLMAAADLAIGAGGSATWERCCLGLPCITATVAANQEILVQEAAADGILLPFSLVKESGSTQSPELHDRLIQCFRTPQILVSVGNKGMDLVDGAGADRVRQSMLKLSAAYAS
jgi:UDP-2,4-diacetamido-2,4,6-trideoxy-beta-L-altropyranose hydrolase